MANTVKHKGILFELGGKTWVLPPITLGKLEQLQDRLGKLTKAGALGPESVKTMLDAVHASMQRNYPEITREEVGELVDVGCMQEVFEAVMDVSGLKRKQMEAAAQGEAQPGD